MQPRSTSLSANSNLGYTSINKTKKVNITLENFATKFCLLTNHSIKYKNYAFSIFEVKPFCTLILFCKARYFIANFFQDPAFFSKKITLSVLIRPGHPDK